MLAETLSTHAQMQCVHSIQ